jgi:hypothetical protein
MTNVINKVKAIVETNNNKEEKVLTMEEINKKAKAGWGTVCDSTRKAKRTTVKAVGKATSVATATVVKEAVEVRDDWKAGWAEGWASVMDN